MKLLSAFISLLIFPSILCAEIAFLYDGHKITLNTKEQRPLKETVIFCSVAAAIKYRIPANIFLAVAEKEGGSPGTKNKNKNGTYDVGYMQFNTDYLKELSRYGITKQALAADNCYPFDLAAWRIANHIKEDSGDIWTRTANYHSKTPRFNQIYRADLIKKAQTWADWLDTNITIEKITPSE